MKKKSIVLLFVMAAFALSACQPVTINVNVPESSEVTKESEQPSSEIASEDITSETPSDSEAEGSSDIDGATIEAIEQFVIGNFSNYAALAYNYPEYKFTTFDNLAKCKLLTYADQFQSDKDIVYSDEYCMAVLNKDRVQTLAKRFFGEDVNTNECQDILTNHSDVVCSDDDGNLYYTLGDWGTYAPEIEDAVIEKDGDSFIAKVTIVMHDGETATNSDPIGTYTVKLSKTSDGGFVVTDFIL